MKTVKNRILSSLFLVFLVGSITSCDDGFGELNTDPASSDNLSPGYLIGYIWTGPAGDRFTTWRSNFIICASWCQQFSSGFGYGNYSTTREDYTEAYMDRLMPNYMAEAADVIQKNPGTAVAGMAIMFKVHFMLRLTDMHGMVPYTQAFQPATITQPEYDEISDIYDAFVVDLKEARELFQGGEGENPGALDPIYGGDLLKWEKFANSLLLRIGLRLSEVDPARSESIVAEAIAAGVFESNDEMAYISHSGAQTDGINAGGIGEVFQDFGMTGHLFRYSDVFVDFIADNNDPRETTLMATYDIDENGAEILTNAGPGGHKGMVAGTYGRDGSVFDFAQPRRDVMVTYDSPEMIMTFAEVEFNRAEAILRGWVSGDAASAYESGVRAAMKMLTLYPNAEEIPDDAIDTYLQQSSVAYSDAQGLRLINTQKWVALLFDGYEAYSNYRRLDIPELVPVEEGFRGSESDGTIPKRVRYPQSELNANAVNYNKAIEIQGPDEINTRLWWDVE
ncbi:MAG: SusD/RagB family nutrient-binding outer membrane lipoprotein [Cyclobacteriaceae bacterium]